MKYRLRRYESGTLCRMGKSVYNPCFQTRKAGKDMLDWAGRP